MDSKEKRRKRDERYTRIFDLRRKSKHRGGKEISRGGR
jgi:hypothetical protein